MIDRLMEAVSRLDGLDLLDRHRIHRHAKLVRRRIELGDRLTEDEWTAMFPAADVCQLARIHLSEPPDHLNMDFEATWVGANAKAAAELDAVAAAAISEGVPGGGSST